jgi:hypothetical protein
MRKSYPGYLHCSERQLEKLWAECVFTFDASALLDMYRLTPEARDAFLEVLQRSKERLWLPHQAGLEYYDNRIEVIERGLGSYASISELARDVAKQFRKSLDMYRQYRWIQVEKWAAVLDQFATEIQDAISREEQLLNGFVDADPVEQKLDEVFRGRVGPPYKDLDDIHRRAEQRLLLCIPPGFKDAASKKDFHRYGDIVLWFQLLDYAKANKKGLIFVTSDGKTDWWFGQKGKTVGPRPELLQEMHVVAGVSFHMYTPDRFIEYAQKGLRSKVQRGLLDKAAQELREVGTEKVADSARKAALAGEINKLDSLRQFELKPEIREAIKGLDSLRQFELRPEIKEAIKGLLGQWELRPEIKAAIKRLESFRGMELRPEYRDTFSAMSRRPAVPREMKIPDSAKNNHTEQTGVETQASPKQDPVKK